MRLVDADELIEHAWRDKLDSRELIVQMIETAPTIKEIPTKIPIHIFERLLDYADGKNDVLDKIRDEIKYLHDWAFSREEILRIIDRYKEESERYYGDNTKRNDNSTLLGQG